ncbi:hypothetical protein [Promicromonospora sp. NFX87]|uniref:hypothetical protein n=1 Tax=Promicromonospora sp. NFX87 TaxID=3402691 RepID=UPI003AFAF7CA
MDETLEFPYPGPVENALLCIHFDPTSPAFAGLAERLGVDVDGSLAVDEVQVLPDGWIRAFYLHMPNLDVDESPYPTDRVDVLLRADQVVAISSRLQLRGPPPNKLDDFDRDEIIEERARLDAGFRSTAPPRAEA